MMVDSGSDLSQRIMRAAKELFFARGFANTSLRAIANEAGTSESGVLRIYGSKDGLLRAVYASCWTEINTRVDEAMAAAAKDDPDPRNLLLQLTRAVWQGYQDDPQTRVFVINHFGSRETTGLRSLENVDPSIDEKVRWEYHHYLTRIHDLCEAVVESQPSLARAGVTSVALGHVFTSIIHGIQAGWNAAAQEDEPVVQVTMEEALTTARFFLYPETLAS